MLTSKPYIIIGLVLAVVIVGGSFLWGPCYSGRYVMWLINTGASYVGADQPPFKYPECDLPRE